MPHAKPKVAETYLCTTIRLDENNTYYVTGFNPQAEMGTAHHMLLFGCEVRCAGGDGGGAPVPRVGGGGGGVGVETCWLSA